MRSLARWIFVVAVACAAGCVSGKKGPRGTNVGVGSDYDGPWNRGGGGGGSPAGPAP